MCDGCGLFDCCGCEHSYTAVQEVKSLKRRAGSSERALRNLAQLCAKGARYYLQSAEVEKEREQELYDEWIKQAEKELAEEEENG